MPFDARDTPTRQDIFLPVPFMIIFLLRFGHWIRTSEFKGSVTEGAPRVLFEPERHKRVKAVIPFMRPLVYPWGGTNPAQSTLIQAGQSIERKPC